MADFRFLEQYVFNEDDQGQEESKHVLYRLFPWDVMSAEIRLGRPFPEELRQLYLTVGYGFLCCHETAFFNRILDPGSVADFNWAQGIYKGDPLAHDYRREYKEKNRLAFFEVSETTFLTLALAEEAGGRCPVYYFDTCVANSLQEFVRRMDREPDYYLFTKDAQRDTPARQHLEIPEQIHHPRLQAEHSISLSKNNTSHERT